MGAGGPQLRERPRRQGSRGSGLGVAHSAGGAMPVVGWIIQGLPRDLGRTHVAQQLAVPHLARSRRQTDLLKQRWCCADQRGPEPSWLGACACD